MSGDVRRMSASRTCSASWSRACVRSGLVQDYTCHLPITQSEIADATGLSPVHVNRTLQELRNEGLIEWKGRTLVASNWRALTVAAGFDPTYLHQLGVAA